MGEKKKSSASKAPPPPPRPKLNGGSSGVKDKFNKVTKERDKDKIMKEEPESSPDAQQQLDTPILAGAPAETWKVLDSDDDKM